MTAQAIMAATRMKTTRAERILMNFSNEFSCVKSRRDMAGEECYGSADLSRLSLESRKERSSNVSSSKSLSPPWERSSGMR